MNASDRMNLWRRNSGHKNVTIARYLGVCPSHITCIMKHKKGLSKPRIEKMKAIMLLEDRLADMTAELNNEIQNIIRS